MDLRFRVLAGLLRARGATVRPLNFALDLKVRFEFPMLKALHAFGCWPIICEIRPMQSVRDPPPPSLCDEIFRGGGVALTGLKELNYKRFG